MRTAAIAATAVAFAIGLVGVLHMPFARGLLMSAGGCPMAGNRATAAQVETVRREAMVSVRGTAPAPARPALGFELDRTTHADVMAWSTREHVACEDVRDGLVHCAQVPASAVGLDADHVALSELSLGFDTQGRLVNLTTLRVRLSDDGAASTLSDIVGRLSAEMGPPHGGSIEQSKLALSSGEGLTSVRYRYRDYIAEVVAMRASRDGLMLREHYMSARD
jgi:hypothetical protein